VLVFPAFLGEGVRGVPSKVDDIWSARITKVPWSLPPFPVKRAVILMVSEHEGILR